MSVHRSDRRLGMAGVVAVSFIVLRACPVAAAIVYGLRDPLRIELDLSDRVKAPEALGFRRGVDVVAQADETRRQSGRERGRLLVISMDLLSGHATVRRPRPMVVTIAVCRSVICKPRAAGFAYRHARRPTTQERSADLTSRASYLRQDRLRVRTELEPQLGHHLARHQRMARS